jgi:hypothetical protein
MKLTKPAMARVAPASQLISVFAGGPANMGGVEQGIEADDRRHQDGVVART